MDRGSPAGIGTRFRHSRSFASSPNCENRGDTLSLPREIKSRRSTPVWAQPPSAGYQTAEGLPDRSNQVLRPVVCVLIVHVGACPRTTAEKTRAGIIPHVDFVRQRRRKPRQDRGKSAVSPRYPAALPRHPKSDPKQAVCPTPSAAVPEPWRPPRPCPEHPRKALPGAPPNVGVGRPP